MRHGAMVRVALLLSGILTMACGEDDTSAPVTTDKACAVLQATSATALTAAGYAMGPGPAVSAGNDKFAIDLPMSPATPTAFAGHVRWLVQTPGTYGVFRVESYPFLVRDTGEQIVPFKRQTGVSAACERIGRVAFIDLAAGEYSLEFAPTGTPTATVALLPLDPQDKL